MTKTRVEPALTVTVELDSTTARMLRMASSLEDEEPPWPNPENYGPYQIAEVARVHDEWDRHRCSWRLLISARLYDAAMDTYDRMVTE